MRSDQLDTAVRITAHMGEPAAEPDYGLARVRTELTDKLRSAFIEPVVSARAGFWLKEQLITTVAGKNRYRVHPRACAGTLHKVEVLGSNGEFFLLDEIQVNEIQDYQRNPASFVGYPRYYCLMADRIEVSPTPQAGLTLRVTYYLRPSQLMQSQSSTQGGDGVVRGLITSINETARTVTVNVVPLDQSLTVPAAITTANQRIDIVSPDGWHEVVLVSSTQTLVGSVFTLPAGTDFTDIEVGQYVRVEDQTDWPCLPEDFHRMLADVTAAKILISKGQPEKSESVLQNCGNDIERWKKLISQRVKGRPQLIPLAYGWR